MATKDTSSALLKEVAPAAVSSVHSKITVVGVGQVGMTCAFSMLVQVHFANFLILAMMRNIATFLARSGGNVFCVCVSGVVDVVADKLKAESLGLHQDPDKLKGEMLDLQHGLAFVKNCKIKADTDYSITAGSKICVVTAGVEQREGEPRSDFLCRSVEIFKGIIPYLVKHSPNTIILVVSNPVDIMTYVAWRLIGLPKERVFGSGTNLDSARLRFLMSEKFHIAPSSSHGWIIGEHGESSVPVWGGVNIAGVPLKQLNPDMGADSYKEQRQLMHRKVVESANEIVKLKGDCSWAIGLSVSHICNDILRNSRGIFALSVNVNGLHGIDKDVYLSLPCVLGVLA